MTLKECQVYLLAAGDGRRAGGPKAWREHAGLPLIERQIRFLLERFDPESVAVSVQKDWMARCAELHREVRWIAVDPKATPLGALQALLKSCPLAGWAFVYHVDMPVWKPELFERLAERISSAAARGVEAIAPAHEGRKGHPVLLSPALATALLALDPARDRLDHCLRTRREDAVQVPFSCIHENWNQPVA